MGKYYCIFGGIWIKPGVSEQVWLVPEKSGGFGVVAAVQSQEDFAMFTLI